MPLHIEKKLMVTSTNRPTDRPTNRQGEYRAICLFRKLENRKKAEICNISKNQDNSALQSLFVNFMPKMSRYEIAITNYYMVALFDTF